MAVNLHKKTTLNLIKILLVLMKSVGVLMNFKMHRISKDKKVNKLRGKLFDQIRLNAKSRFV